MDRGFFCPAALLRDPWLDPIRGEPTFHEVVRRADLRSRDAEAGFRRLGGDRLLGLSA
jgi:hypothetical protein